MMPDRDWIGRHIPHQGRMCLLERVVHWNADCIECATNTHRAPDHPLRSAGRLGAACLIEYAAQAMAVHGALLQAPASDAGFGLLTSARGVDLLVARLDDIEDELLIRAERQHGDARGALYRFRVSTPTRLLAQGRATVLLDAAALRAGRCA